MLAIIFLTIKGKSEYESKRVQSDGSDPGSISGAWAMGNRISVPVLRLRAQALEYAAYIYWVRLPKIWQSQTRGRVNDLKKKGKHSGWVPRRQAKKKQNWLSGMDDYTVFLCSLNLEQCSVFWCFRRKMSYHSYHLLHFSLGEP